MEKFFSIIIPVYNKEKYIENTIESVLCQKYKNYEVIIIDDKSTDKSYSIMEKCKDKFKENNCIIYRNEKNKGVSSSRNRGIQLSSGEYLFFLDADDEISDNYFLTKINNLLNKYNANYVMTTRNYYNKFSKPNFKLNSSYLKPLEKNLFKIMDKKKAVIKGNFPFGGSGSAIVSKELIGDNKYDSSESYFEDWLFFLKLYLKSNAYFYNNNSIKINYDPNSLSKNIKSELIYETPKLYSMLNENNEYSMLRKNFFWIWMKSIINNKTSFEVVNEIVKLHKVKMKKNFILNKYSIYCYILIVTKKTAYRVKEKHYEIK